MTQAYRRHCPQCRTPLLKLKDFRGVSSSDAPVLGDRNAHDYSSWGLWAIVPDIATEVSGGIRRAWRAGKAARLRAQVLPRHPAALVCPQCLHVIETPQPNAEHGIDPKGAPSAE